MMVSTVPLVHGRVRYPGEPVHDVKTDAGGQGRVPKRQRRSLLLRRAMLVKSKTIAVVVPEFLFVLLLNLIEEVGTVLMLLHRSISIENRLPPVDRIVPLQASLCCKYNAGF